MSKAACRFIAEVILHATRKRLITAASFCVGVCVFSPLLLPKLTLESTPPKEVMKDSRTPMISIGGNKCKKAEGACLRTPGGATQPFVASGSPPP
jgi:hypothetical protein